MLGVVGVYEERGMEERGSGRRDIYVVEDLGMGLR